MESVADGGAVQGRALFEQSCAQCHGISGQGDYYAPHFRPPRIAGAAVNKIVRQVRHGGEHMPAFSAAAIPDAALAQLGAYVHDSLANPPDEPGRIGPRELDPFSVGVFVWAAMGLLLLLLSQLFAEGRN